MKNRYVVALTLLAGVGLGAVAAQGLHAQAKPQVYLIEEIDATNPDAYAKEFLPLIAAANRAAGVRNLAAGGKLTVIGGTPPKARVVIQVWDSVESAQAYRASAAYRDARAIGDKYATFRTFIVEGVPQ
jgi:uncharacterized protein (DUF1330 family)